MLICFFSHHKPSILGIPFMEKKRYGETQTARNTQYWLGMEGKLRQSSRILTHESDTLKWLWLWANFGINNITTSQFHVMQPQKRNAVWAMACSCESEGIDSPGDDKRPWCSSASGTASWANSMIEVERLLVGGFNPSEKYESQLGWWHSQYMENMFETTNQSWIVDLSGQMFSHQILGRRPAPVSHKNNKRQCQKRRPSTLRNETTSLNYLHVKSSPFLHFQDVVFGIKRYVPLESEIRPTSAYTCSSN